MKDNYEIIRVMNNNVILTKRLEDNIEAVLIGKGIGFKKKKGQISTIYLEKIEKAYYTYDEKLKDKYQVLFSDIDHRVVGTCAELVSMAEKKLGKLSSKVLIVLTDHISFALERIKMGMKIENPFVYEIKMLYPMEYAIAQKGRELFIEELGIDILEEEVGFIAWHLNAAKQNKSVKENVKTIRLIKKTVKQIEENLGYKIDIESRAYSRLINHLKGIMSQEKSAKEIINPLKDIVKTELTQAYNITILVKELIEEELGFDVTEDELAYLTIHIDRLRLMSQFKKN